MQSLLRIQKIRSKDNIKSFRTLYNHVESCVRNLKALKLEAKGYGSLLIPILKEKLPDELKIVISRKFGSSIWTLDLLLTYLDEELRAQENCTNSGGGKAERTDESDPLYSALGLFSNTEKNVCVFCKKSHSSAKCRKVTNTQSRRDILIREKRCFVCLARGHRSNACRDKYSCNRCNKRHHISICDEGKQRSEADNISNNQISILTDANSEPQSESKAPCSCSCNSVPTPVSQNCAQVSSRSVLLQTATSEIFGSSCHKVKTRLLFDTGSQRSYITTELKDRLKLKCVRKENVVIKTFGNLNNAEIKRLEVVQFKVKHRKSSKYVLVEALCVPDICSPIANQKLDCAKKLNEFSDLVFADVSEEFDLSIGVLVGIDFYFRFFTGKRRESKEGVVACESSLGWILSGSVVFKGLTEVTYSHQMRVEVQTVDPLDAKLHKFWQIEEAESAEDNSVINQFTKDIYHDGTRMNKIGILADIKQAFLNISIHPDHRDFLRFLWRDPSSSDREIVVYRFLRVVFFGLTSSPFLLNGTIRQHMSKYLESDKAFVEQFLSDLYVDDITTGTDTVESGKIFCEKALSSMSDAGLQLRKWTSNDAELQEFFSSKEPPLQPKCIEDDSSFAQSQFQSQDECKRVLGVEWDISKDVFVFRFDSFLEKGRTITLTKRTILSLAASIYDPLGILTPITARVKTIFQLVCKVKCGWDDKVPPDIACAWYGFLDALESVKIVEIDRFAFVSCNSDTLRVELHGFCDSSEILYCSVIYLRVISETGISVFFLTSKSKVAPLKKVTIPRLELLSCVLLSDLLNNVRSALSGRISVDATRFTALVYRFVSNIKAKRNNGHVIKDVISSEEQEAALTNWIKEEQRLMKSIPTYRKLTKSLGVFEKDGLLRVRGRFDNADITTDQKHPILIRNATSPFTKLVIWNSHERTKHQGIDSTLADDVRRRYWIVQGRKAVKNTIRQCVVCIRFQASPWWGGFYERLVRSVKSSLKKILGLSFLTYEELETVLIEIESSINTRPLTYVNEDDTETIITPNHLIFGTDIHDNFSFVSANTFVPVKRLRHLHKILEHFRNRFSSIYINELRQSHMYREINKPDKRKLVVGDIVLVKDDTHLPRSRWPIAKVEKLVSGKDGNIRGAKLSTVTKNGKRGSIHRPLAKIIPFEIVDNHQQTPETPVSPTATEPAQMVENCEKVVHNRGRTSTRKAAIEGQNLRRLRNQYHINFFMNFYFFGR
ncbi:uncharacterized protein [Clytia hemisphaerica]|uniref:uncharacterized protein n=1 Tax=Clytia hemisphaerica TaxID=252671 RepID=UPI0034D60B25